MTEKLKNLVKSKNNLIVIVLAGILLMIIAWPVKKETKNNNSSDLNMVTETEHGTVNTFHTSTEDEDYARQMEAKLEEILGKMEGAGQVRVIITIKSSTEKIVEKDLPVVRSNTTEEDGEGGKRTVNNVDTQENTVYSQEGNNQEPYVVKTLSPQVEGVLVLAEGAGTGSVSKNISDAIQVLFGIEAHRIKVIKMECIGSQNE